MKPDFIKSISHVDHGEQWKKRPKEIAMPADYIILNGDKSFFDPAFGAATVTDLKTGVIRGSANATFMNKKVCVEGDEDTVEVKGCPYTAGPYSIPGTGTLKIESLAGDQKAQNTTFGKKSAILKGKKFNAVFEVMSPAQMPPPASTPDPLQSHSGGKGSFVTENTKWKAE